jgi:hypothetical protein
MFRKFRGGHGHRLSVATDSVPGVTASATIRKRQADLEAFVTGCQTSSALAHAPSIHRAPVSARCRAQPGL